MSLNDTIESLGARTLQVTRVASAAYVDGVKQTGVETTFPIRANVQSSTGRVLDSPTEHDRVSETKVLHTVSELRARTPTTEPDSIELDGEWWTVVTVKECVGFDGITVEFYRVEISRDDIG